MAATILGGELRNRNNKATAFVALPQSQNGERNAKVVQYECAASIALLRACTKNKDLHRGTIIHDDILKKGLLEKCSDSLVIMYAKCGELAKAQALLDMHKSKNVVPWTALIAGYARERQSHDALDCFERMQREGVPPNAVTYSCVLKACGTIGAADKGKQIHDEIARQGLLRDNVVLGNALVDMYGKCGALRNAECVLQELPFRNVVSWNTLITAHALHGQGEQALNCFERMQHEGIPPDAVTFACILKACGAVGAVDKGTQIHEEISRQGLLQDNIVLGTALVDMYAKVGDLGKAGRVLEELPARDVVSWNALIAGYAQHGQGEQALDCFEHMQHEGIPPNGVTYTCILKACGTIRAIDKGKQIHDEIVRQGLLRDSTVLGTALVDMYGKCGALGKAECVLEELPSRNVVSWNALIAGYAQHDQGEQALDCYERMQHEGIPPNAVTYACILKACGAVGAADKGKQIHDEIVRQGLLQDNIVLGNALVDMYGRCGALGKAEGVFQELPLRDVVSWNALIAGHVQQGQSEHALDCFERMQHEGVTPNAVTYASVLRACGTVGAADTGKLLHNQIMRQGLLRDNIVLGNALVDMYGKCGALEKAERVLEELPSRNVVSWNALIAGYAQHGHGEQALDCFERMQHEGIPPDVVTYAWSLKACGAVGAADKGKQIHDEIEGQGLLLDNIVLGTALVDMYAKCGAFGNAERVLENLPSRDVVSWSTLIAGYVQQGKGEQALDSFKRMQHEGVPPNAVTYACILKACGTVGAADMGKQIHDEISRQGLLRDNILLGNALVDMYGKCGVLGIAECVLEELSSRSVVSWNALITAYGVHGQGEQALDCFERMQHEGIPPDAVTFACILKACGAVGAIDKGKQIHEEILRQGLLRDNIVLGTALMDMYAKFGALEIAERMLDELPARDVVSWNALIAGYAQHGHGEQALDCFERMQQEGITPDVVTYACVLKACGTIGAADMGKQIHDEIVKQGMLRDNIVLGNALVDMYGKSGVLERAERILEELPSRNVVSWNALIAGYAQYGQGEQALDCFERMQHEGIPPDVVTYACILKACGAARAADKGKQIHEEIAAQGLLRDDMVLGNALVDMYGKCGALSIAERVLEELPSQNVVTWNALITAYAQHGQGKQALDCFERMQHEGIPPNGVTYVCVLKACGAVGAVDKGKLVHNEIARQGLLQDNIVLGTALVDMYGKCGALSKAERVLEELPSRNVASWNALITGYAQHGQGEQALHCFECMQHEGIPPDVVTYACILKSCGIVGAAVKGGQIHDEIEGRGLLQDNMVLGTALVDMYAKCGALEKAEHILEELPSRDAVSWNALIGGYAQHEQGEQALNCFERMQHEGIPPDAVTYACSLKACGTVGAADKGKQIHDEIVKHGLLQDNIVLGNALVDMYAKCGALGKAEQVLQELPSRDVVSWNALIRGYAQHGQGEQALGCFERMQLEGIPPDVVTYGCSLKACGAVGAADKGKQIHDEIARQGLLRDNVVLGNALVDMYAKCGAPGKAEHVLRELPSRDVVSWNALIAGYVQQGRGEQALDCLERMQQEGIPPNVVTFCCVLNVCNHLGLVEEGQMLFINMSTRFGVKPDMECYTCMIDLFGRAGHLERAARLIREMPSSNYSGIWHALLGACQKWGDKSIGRWAFDQAVQVDERDAASYVLMANIYAAAGMQVNARNIEVKRMETEAWKESGCSQWIDLSGAAHEFCAGDEKHAQNKIINAKLEDLRYKVSQQGYSPALHWVSPNISNAAKKHLICRQSEKLALLYTCRSCLEPGLFFV